MAATPTDWTTCRLTATSPSTSGERVQTAASAAAADATVEEVKALRSDLNAIGAALAAYTQKTAKLMAKFDVEGIPARV